MIDETVIQLNVDRYWLYATVDSDTNRLLHIRLSPPRTQALIEMFLAELRDKHHVNGAVFFIDRAPWLQAACHRHSHRFQHETYGNRNNAERVFRKVK